MDTLAAGTLSSNLAPVKRHLISPVAAQGRLLGLWGSLHDLIIILQGSLGQNASITTNTRLWCHINCEANTRHHKRRLKSK